MKLKIKNNTITNNLKINKMKKSILTLFVVAVVLVSCKQKNNQDEPLNNTMMENDSTMHMTDTTMTHQDSKMMDENSKLYACPMHPEVQGKLNDKCSKCGMKLTEEVK
jgi:hypothetical protein